MKKLFIALIILTIATPALARHKCTPYMKKYWRNALGTNVVLVGWRCKGSGNGYHVNSITRIGVFGLGLDDATIATAQADSNIKTIQGTQIDRGYGLISVTIVTIAGKS